MSLHEEKAKKLFLEGCNCSQAVFAAFSDITGLDKDIALKISSGFGGGFGRMRLTCGAVCGMTLAANYLFGYNDIIHIEAKTDNYKLVSNLINNFKSEMGSANCKEILGLTKYEYSSVAQKRDEEFYKTRPCLKCVMTAARTLDNYINSINKTEP